MTRLKRLVYYHGDKGTDGRNICFHQSCRKGVEGTRGGSHPPNSILNLKLSDFWKTAEQSRNTRLQISSWNRRGGGDREGGANFGNFCSKKCHKIITLFFRGSCERSNLRFKQMIYGREQLFRIARTILNNI